MGNDSFNSIPGSIPKNQLTDFVRLLGYKGYGSNFQFFVEDDYKYMTGVFLRIGKEDETEKAEWIVYTRTPAACSGYDLAYQNYTVKQIRLRFGGSFTTDLGKNRYFPVGAMTKGPENGCYFAFFRLRSYFAYIHIMLADRDKSKDKLRDLERFGVPSSTSLLANITTTFIASIIENYFRETYISLLTYSEKKEGIFKNARFNSSDLLDVGNHKMRIEEAAAISISFQNIHRINETFKNLDNRVKIYETLSKPYRRRKESLFLTLDRVLEHRHALVHRLDIDAQYSDESILRDIDSVQVALQKVYEHICTVYKWAV